NKQAEMKLVSYAAGQAGLPALPTQTRFRNSSLSSMWDAASLSESNEPVSLMLRAARINAPQATRASAPPTEIRRTPRSVSLETERSPGEETKTLTGFG